MKRLQPVIWAKGTFLTPQHLQCQDRFIEDTLQFHTEALNFRPWGFQRLEIDHAALASGTMALTRASGIFADGLLFDAPDSDALRRRNRWSTVRSDQESLSFSRRAASS